MRLRRCRQVEPSDVFLFPRAADWRSFSARDQPVRGRTGRTLVTRLSTLTLLPHVDPRNSLPIRCPPQPDSKYPACQRKHELSCARPSTPRCCSASDGAAAAVAAILLAAAAAAAACGACNQRPSTSSQGRREGSCKHSKITRFLKGGAPSTSARSGRRHPD